MLSNSKNHKGFTLLEVLLTTALMAILLGGLGMFTATTRKAIATQEKRLAEIQLANKILQRIASDLRSVVIFTPQDPEALEALLSQGSEAEGEAGAEGSETDVSEETAESSEETDSEETGGQNRIFFGSPNKIKIEISRSPRLEEYQSGMQYDQQTGVVSQSSTTKNVAYYLFEENEQIELNLSETEYDPEMSQSYGSVGRTDGGDGHGLIRREIDSLMHHVIVTSTADSGLLQAQENYIAPEVTHLAFRYFDGEEWLEDWNSIETKTIPMAVEITIALDPYDEEGDEKKGSRSEEFSRYENDLLEGPHVYRLIVHLPTAEPVEEETEL
ncbi:MAG: prepilin-type N-terminal cleavage/methylation domain-containing protein [Pirellulaceae bacterium]|nr:prepilin-type N-terminal cleavage/methylation domain-containing protein [Pirellulaceae bacterium]